MKTIQVSNPTHRLLVERKLASGVATLDAVIQTLLGKGSRRDRLAAMNAPVDAVCRRYKVQRLRLFGSAARGEDGPDSDVDLIVDFAKGARPGLFGLAELGEDLESILGTRVDVTTEAGLHPRIKAKVLAAAEVVWSA